MAPGPCARAAEATWLSPAHLRPFAPGKPPLTLGSRPSPWGAAPHPSGAAGELGWDRRHMPGRSLGGLAPRTRTDLRWSPPAVTEQPEPGPLWPKCADALPRRRAGRVHTAPDLGPITTRSCRRDSETCCPQVPSKTLYLQSQERDLATRAGVIGSSREFPAAPSCNLDSSLTGLPLGSSQGREGKKSTS